MAERGRTVLRTKMLDVGVDLIDDVVERDLRVTVQRRCAAQWSGPPGGNRAALVLERGRDWRAFQWQCGRATHNSDVVQYSPSRMF